MPRDPKRIPLVLAEVQRLWETYPDMRLGQLIENLVPGDTYYADDDDLLRQVSTVLTHGWVPR